MGGGQSFLVDRDWGGLAGRGKERFSRVSRSAGIEGGAELHEEFLAEAFGRARRFMIAKQVCLSKGC